MRRAAVVKALRCAADLTASSAMPVSDAACTFGFDVGLMLAELQRVGCELWPTAEPGEDTDFSERRRTRLLEAARRIEEGE